MQKSPQGSLLIFYLLVFYVLLQFCWWTFLLFQLNTEIFLLKEELSRNASAASLHSDFMEKLNKKHLMILGEGLVFLILLSVGMWQTRKSFQRETNAARQQKNFLLSVTHELKSPVASIKLFLETLAKRELPKEKQQELILRAVEESNRLNQLIENILVAARIDNHAFHLHLEQVNLSDFVLHFTKDFNHYGDQGLVSTNLQSNLWVTADKMAMQSILQNLVENALKYSSKENVVTISLALEENQVVLRVKDLGTGIHPAEKQKIFEKFFRAGNEETRKTKGTGLGLYIVKYLILKQQGTISVLDNIPKGSIFEIRLKQTPHV